MCAKAVRILATLVCFYALGAASLLAQAAFTVTSGSTIVADIGYAEPAGSIAFTVSYGTSAADFLVITYPAPITNNAASEISITGTGHFPATLSAPVIDHNSNALLFNIPAGGQPGDMITISGVRLAVAGRDVYQAKAIISISNNTITSAFPVVISSAMQPFSIDSTGSQPLSYAAGNASNGTSSFTISENFENAFQGMTNFGGQTVPTLIRITPFPALPAGMKITFDAVATAATGTTLTTASGLSETVPRDDGSSDVVFSYTAAPGSPSTIESFQINVSLTQPPASGSGSIQFKAALLPFGAAVPNTDYPSTDIPRYAERLVPDENDLATGTTELFFPFRIDADGTYTGLAITNPNEFQVKATLTAHNANGDLITGLNITNPVDIVLPKNGQYAKTASEIFGDGFNKASEGMIRFVGKSSGLKGFYLIGDDSGPKLDGANAEMESSQFWYMPVVFHQGHEPFNSLGIYNPAESASATIELKLIDAHGSQVASGSETIPAGGFLLRDVCELFGINLGNVQGGYVQLESDIPVMFQNTFGNEMESNVLSAQLPLSTTSFYVPHFASGGQLSTELTFVNTSSSDGTEITFSLLDDNGMPIASAGNPVTVPLDSGQQITRTVAGLFPNLGSGLMTGSIKIDVKLGHYGPFIMSPSLIGSVRFAGADGSASAAVPLIMSPTPDCVYSHVAQGAGFYTGVAIQNTNETATGYTIDVYNKDGSLVGSYSSTLAPHARIAKLISQLVPASAGQVNGYFRIRGDAPLVSFALFGTNDVRSLSVITPQILQ